MKKNQFVVDLGDMRLTKTQRNEINAAIQTAVTGTLAKRGISNKVVLLPVSNWPKGPILNGIIARPWNQFNIKDLKNVVGKR